ncbi:HNH endonuclease [Pseudanabaena phage Pan5]|nr:HNH endonuclease [Pseudanabaena phage Pan5]
MFHHIKTGLSMNTKIELWRDVVGYENLYRVSNLGRVKSLSRNGCGLKDKLVAIHLNNCGYLTVLLSNNGERKRHLVHRLVASAFILNPDNLEQVNHINGCKEDNRVENLEWCTREYNVNHALKTGLKKDFGLGRIRTETHKINLSNSLKGRKSPCGMLGKKWSDETRRKIIAANTGKSRNKGKVSYQFPVLQFSLNGLLIQEYESATMAAKALGVKSSSGISMCCNNKTKSYKKYLWKFKSKN